MRARARRGWGLALAAAAALALGAGCDGGSAGAAESDPGGAAGTTAPSEVVERSSTLGPFLAGHWELPVPPQGEPPAGWSALEQSLAPSDCGSCHPAQYRQWRTSLHAGAWSPGLSGQLVEGPLAAPAQVRHCQTCHAPLSEQQPFDAAGEANPGYDPELRQHGIVCAGCHVRAHQRFGPPRRPGSPEPAASPPHGGFEVRPEFGESRFCAECHQFFDDPGVGGKPIQNTWAEWRDSPAAAEGRTCQSCHMPDRAHLWRGIHDPDMVRDAVEVTLQAPEVAGDLVRAELVVHSREIGHAFPTYVTPRVFLAVWQEDAAGRDLEGTRVEDVVGREIDFAAWEEVFDTRIPAGGSRTLDYVEPRRRGAVGLVGQVRVEPDHHYRGVFESLLDRYEQPEARARIEEALRRARDSGYVLRELRHPLPGDSLPSRGEEMP